MSNTVIIDQTINTVTTDQCPDIHNSVVVNNDIPSIIGVTENVTNIVTVAVPGPQGPAGPQGPVGLGGDITGSEYYVAVYKSATGLFTGSLYQSASFTSIRNATAPEDPANPDILYVNGDGVDTYNLISAHGNYNNYVQLNVQNYNNSTEASSDIVATANNGTEEDFYINMGINSEGFTNVGNIGGQNDAYVYSTGNDLYIGNASPGKQVIIFNGGLDAANNANLWIHDQGTVGINTPTYNNSNPPSLQVEAIGSDTPTVVQVEGETDSYLQVAITNRSGGNTASADLAIYNDIDPVGQTAGYVDIGINSTNYVFNGTYPGKSGDAYIFTDSHHLVLGSISGSSEAKVSIFAGGVDEIANSKLILYGNNQHEMTGSLNATDGFTGSLYGTASWALNTVTSSNILGGQNNYVPLWSGSSNLTSSIIYQNGSLLGINNPTPNRTLDLISLQSGSYVAVASFIAPNNNIVGNNTQFYLGAQQAPGNSISWTFNYQGNNSAANRMGFEFNGYATPVLSMFRNGNSVFGGAIDNGFKHDVQGTGRYTNNLTVTGSVTATAGFTGSLFGTSSWATNALSSSYTTNAVSSSYPIAVTGSSLYSTSPAAGIPTGFSKSNGIFFGVDAGYQTTDTGDSIFLGYQAGYKADSAYGSQFLGSLAGYSASFANNSFFIGYQAGNTATYADNSNFIGLAAGQNATRAKYSNFIGLNAGYGAVSASDSNFIGDQAGNNAKKASYSTLIGFKAGFNSNLSIDGIGSNNVVIGTNITLPNDNSNAINIGGLLFGTGSYSNTGAISPFSGSANGRVGINQPTPIFNLDVSGSGRYTNGLQVTSSLIAPNITGSLFGTASWALNALTSSYVLNAISASYLSGSSAIVTNLTSSNDVNINGLTVGTGNNQYNTVFGYSVPTTLGGSSYDNVIIGYTAASASTFLRSSVIIGAEAYKSINSGAQTIAIGAYAMQLSTTGDSNIAIGRYTLRVAEGSGFNTIVGESGGYYITTGKFNTAVGGDQPAASLTTGNRNTGFGTYTLKDISTGEYNTTVGYRGGASAGGSYNTIIGSENFTTTGDGNGSNNTILGARVSFTSSMSNNIILADGAGNIKYRWDTTQNNIYGKLAVTGSVTATQGFTGSLFGTASWAQNALTASFGGNFTASNALINGTITAQTLVVQTITSSVEFVTGSTQFGSLLTNTHQFTGSVTITGSLSVNGSPVILTNQTSSMSVASASLATTASYVLNAVSASYASTASIAVSSSYALTASYVSGSSSTSISASYAATSSYSTAFYVSGTLNVGKTNIEFQENTNVTSGSWRVVSSEPTASYKAAFFDYVMFSGSIARAGTVYSVWSASYAEYYENYTGDVGGSTSGVTLQAAISGSNIQLQATASNSTWTIRSLVRML